MQRISSLTYKSMDNLEKEMWIGWNNQWKLEPVFVNAVFLNL